MRTQKQRLSFLLIFICCLQLLLPATQTEAATKPKVSSHAYIIMDANTGNVLYSHNSTKKIYPASTVKLMTALVVLDKCSTKKKIHITKRMLKQVPSDAAAAGLRAGNSYTVSDLLHMLLLPSAGDAAVVLACGSYGSVGKFVTAMNKKAKKLALNNTSFDNPIGLDIGNNYKKTYTTAKDFAKLARYTMTNSIIRSIVSKAKYTVSKAKYTKAFTIYNTNRFLSSVSYNHNLFQMIGGKTGTTRAAGSVLITSAKDKNGHEIICAFFGNKSHAEMYSDIKKLLNYTFKQGKAGKLSWKKGFWDVRFRDSEKIIRNYYNKGKIPVSTRFYPTKKINQKKTLNLINRIAGTNFSALSATKSMTVLDFAKIYYAANMQTEANDKNEILSLQNTDSTVQNPTLEELKDDCSAYKHIADCSEEELQALAYLLATDILPDSVSKDTSASITKEQAVLLADRIKKGQ